MPPAETTKRQQTGMMIVLLVCGTGNLTIALWAGLTDPSWNSDFMGLWSFARFALSEPVRGIYQAAPLAAFQRLIYPGFQSEYVFAYPPSFLVVILWLGKLGFWWARLIWTVAGLGALGAASFWFLRGRRPWVGMLAVLASPACLLNGVGGETGYFTSAFLLGGLAALPNRPWLAGFLLGLLSVKPQLGLLVPVALLAWRDWRAMAAAGLTFLGLALLSLVLLPAALWLDWLRGLGLFQQAELRSSLGLWHEMVTVTATARDLGAGGRLADDLQLGVGALVALVTYAACRYAACRRSRRDEAVAAFIVAGFLVTPHAYAYDSIPLIAALALLFGGVATAPWVVRLADVISLVIFLGPLLLLSPAAGFFLYAIPELMLYVVLIRLVFAKPVMDGDRHEPELSRSRA